MEIKKLVKSLKAAMNLINGILILKEFVNKIIIPILKILKNWL
jgi:hypothetical protein